ncbi:hypothetical protein RJ640_014961 [Escallonia rubra]|uniref:RING-type domain-containing protein n=1 Tax=Escallonia rubra TaxID=112253 RepID=A0AA88US79_9ASTE|nr:hypothetical protein RJ640_014961 [Escallonia rubra]
MASLVAKACSSSSSQLSPATSVQEKGSRNKRKFRADPPLADASKIISLPQNEGPSYEFSAEKFEVLPSHGSHSGCDMCCASQDHSDALKLDLGLSCAVGPSEVASIRPRDEMTAKDEFHDADWSEFTESQLEELVLSNLDTIFKSAIKKIITCGYTEEVATKAVLRSGLCYGCKDTVSNIVENTLAFLRSGHELDPSREHYFEDLQQMEKYILAELVCVLREVRPFFSTGDAMWCLLICDMNVAHACAMDSDPFSSLVGDGAPIGSSISTQPQLVKSSETLPNPSNTCVHNCPCETPTMASVPCAHTSQLEAPPLAGVSNSKPKASFVLNGLIPGKESSNSMSSTLEKSFSGVGTSQPPVPEEKSEGSRKISGITKREYILRQKSIRLEKTYRTYGSKGASRSGKLSSFGGLILDKKLKSVSDSAGINVKNGTLKISKAMGVELSRDNLQNNVSTNIGLASSSAFNLETVDNSISTSPKTNNLSTLPTTNAPPALTAADTELSLSLPEKSYPALPAGCSDKAPKFSYAGFSYDKSLGKWVPQDKKDEMILKLVPRLRELQNQLQEWTEWANQKVMQAARRLGKDKAELKTLRQEKEEVERLKKEKLTLEENTLKKLFEMENALSKASGQVERANAAVRRLEMENASLRKQLDIAKLSATESAASCQDVSKREKKTLVRFQAWEKQKNVFQEELVAERNKLAHLRQELEQARDIRDQLEARWKQEERAKEELLTQASSIRKEREQLEALAKSKDDVVRLKAEKNLQRYKDDIKKLEIELSQLRLKTDSSKIAALRRGADGSYASKLTDCKTARVPKESDISYISRMVTDFEDYSGNGGVKRERECVMCLSEEMSVVFLPCAHQVVCMTCNELHEKQGMKDCPSCRCPIQRRVSVRYALS